MKRRKRHGMKTMSLWIGMVDIHGWHWCDGPTIRDTDLAAFLVNRGTIRFDPIGYEESDL